MIKSDKAMPANSWFNFPWNTPKEQSLDTLNAFVRDSEHEIMAVLTALQAQLDLLHTEQLANNMPVNRFPGMNRAISSLIADTYALSYISSMAVAPRCKTKISLELLFKEVLLETKQDFGNNQVSLTCSIPEGSSITGETGSLRQMCEGVLIVVMQDCQPFDSVKVVVIARKKKVSISYEIGGGKPGEDNFTPWRLRQMNRQNSNGDGIKLAAIDAMARLHQGQLDVARMPGLRDTYRLIINS